MICVEGGRSGGNACSANEVNGFPVRLTWNGEDTEVSEFVP